MEDHSSTKTSSERRSGINVTVNNQDRHGEMTGFQMYYRIRFYQFLVCILAGALLAVTAVLVAVVQNQSKQSSQCPQFSSVTKQDNPGSPMHTASEEKHTTIPVINVTLKIDDENPLFKLDHLRVKRRAAWRRQNRRGETKVGGQEPQNQNKSRRRKFSQQSVQRTEVQTQQNPRCSNGKYTVCDRSEASTTISSEKIAKEPFLCRLETETDPQVLRIMGTPGIGVIRQGQFDKICKVGDGVLCEN